MKIVIFGLGDNGHKLYSKFKEHSDFCNDYVVAFSDNNSDLWNSYEDSIPVIPPIELSNCDFDAIIVASIYEKSICRQLSEYGLADKIMMAYEYDRRVYALYQYRKRYSGNTERTKRIFDDKLVVYTSITGNYDDLKEPLFRCPDIDYVCFTNNRSIKSDIWNVEYISSETLDNMHLAKRVKLFPHEYLSGFNTSVWVDGKFQIKSDIRKYISKYERTEPILCFPHFSRACIYEEAGCCVLNRIGNKKDIIHQIAFYEREGYPVDNGLYEMGCIVRNHNDDEVIKIMEEWWKEIEKFSYRDQISFPYVCWKNDFKPDICDQDIYNNEWLLCTRNYSKAFDKKAN
jgi:hypothetical protein